MATVDARAARERKQKIFVVVGGIVLLGLLAFQLPRILGGSSSAAEPAETTTGADPAATSTVPPTSAPTQIALRDTDRRPPADPGKLRSFSLFSAKNPFVQQVKAPSPAAGSTGAGASGGAPGKEEKPKGSVPSEGFTVGGTPAATVTVISVNGNRQALAPGAAFPAADPVFVLVAEQPQAKAVVVGVAGGAYESGSKTTKLRLGKPLVLVNTTTGARYRLVLIAVGTGATSAATTRESPKPPPTP
jgi:hypothetical protein